MAKKRWIQELGRVRVAVFFSILGLLTVQLCACIALIIIKTAERGFCGV